MWCEGQESRVPAGDSCHCFHIILIEREKDVFTNAEKDVLAWLDGKTIKELKMVSNGSTFNAYLMEE